jgi:hypothetical protein
MERHRDKTSHKTDYRSKPKLWQVAVHDEKFCNCPMNSLHTAQDRNLKRARQGFALTSKN